MLFRSVTALKAPWDIFPEFAPPQFVVQTEAPGLSTTEVELLVTAPIESCLNGIPQLRTVRSSSTAGLSVVTAIFHEGSDVLISRQLANERLSEVRSRLPKQADSPRLTPLKASTSRLLMIGLTSSSVTLQDLRTFATWNLKRQIEGVSGVAQCEVFGGEQKQFQIFIRPSDLVQHKVSLDQIVASARKSIAAGGAGFLETENQRLAIQQIGRAHV